MADYTRLNGRRSLDQLLNMTRAERNVVEQAEASRIADHLMERLPTTKKARAELLKEGQRLAYLMGWDRVIEYKLLPMLKRVTDNQPTPSNA
ncbi:MAG: hypothetical protein ACYTGQ_05955 [Planctomycetota bacterium]